MLQNQETLSLTESVSDAQTQALVRFLNFKKEKEPVGSINEYYPGKRDTAYFRFSYRIGKRIQHKHIPGGNVWSSLAGKRANQIQEMINSGASVRSILDTINKY